MEKLERLVKFSISMRKETQQLVDQVANDNNRSRSCMIDMICMEYFTKKKEKEKSAIGHKA